MSNVPPIYFEIDASHRIRISIVGDKVHFIKERKYPVPGKPSDELVVWDTEYPPHCRDKIWGGVERLQFRLDEKVEDIIPLAWLQKLAKVMVLL